MNAANVMANDRTKLEGIASYMTMKAMFGNCNHFAAFFVSSGLMKADDASFEAAAAHICAQAVASGLPAYDIWLRAINELPQGAEFARDIVMGAANHMLNGTDTEDADSVGGFSQREIDIFMNFAAAKAVEEIMAA